MASQHVQHPGQGHGNPATANPANTANTNSNNTNHPVHGRPRAKSGFSFRSHSSHDDASHPPKSPKSPKSKHERKESASDKRKTHYDPSTKANPNAAMNEAQPIAAALEKPTLESLRSFQHTDTNGNIIAEPDLSNPTRSRWERPLDTIRSFEAAIDGEYKRRTIAMRADTTDVASMYGSRRSSYYGGEQARYSTASYYNQRPRDSYDGYAPGGPVGGPVGGPPRARYGNRMQSDPGWNTRNNPYGPPNPYHQSRDTVHTNGSAGSHSDGPSDNSQSNSSFERAAPAVKSPYDGAEYGWSQSQQQQQPQGYFPPQAQFKAAQQQAAAYHQQQQQAQQAPPPPPHGAKPIARVPVALNSAPAPQQQQQQQQRPKTLSKTSDDKDKRKSWFKRKFSKD